MASYFNKTRGPITVSLRTGEPVVIGPKQTLHVTPEQDRSASLLSRVKKGLLVQIKSAQPSTIPATAAPTKPVSASKLPDEPALEVPSKDWTKSRLTEHAELLGLEVPSSWTKVEILKAIEEAGR